MRTILILIGFLANLIDIFLLTNVLEYFCSRRYKNKTLYFATVLTLSVGITALKTFVNFYLITTIIYIIMLIICFFSLYKPLRGVLIGIVAWFIITMGIEWTIINFLMVFLNKNFIDLGIESYTIVFAAFIAKGAALSVVYWLFKRRNANNVAKAFSLYQYIFFLMSFLVLLNSTVLSDSLIEGKELSNYFAIYYFVCIIVLFLSILYLFDRLIKIVKENEEARIIKEQEKAQQIFAEEIQTMLEHLKGLNHDYRHHLELLIGMTELHNNQKAYGYVQQLLSDYSKTSLGFIDNCHVISLLLMQKAKTAKSKNIEFDCKVPSILNTEIRETDLNVILSNLLENAFEAVLKKDMDRKVSLNIYARKDCLFIKIHNTYCNDLKLWHGQYITTKENNSFHGYGLKNVKRIVEEYDGEVWLKPKCDLFEVSVAMPI